MTEQELRALVREAIALYADGGARSSAVTTPGLSCRSHPSHAMFMVPTGFDADGPCVIEPAVPCNHCGFCRSYGH